MSPKNRAHAWPGAPSCVSTPLQTRKTLLHGLCQRSALRPRAQDGPAQNRGCHVGGCSVPHPWAQVFSAGLRSWTDTL